MCSAWQKEEVLITGVFALVLFFTSTCRATDFYVATNGLDTWSGTIAAPNSGKTDGPFATLERARDAIRALKQAQGSLTGGVNVWLRGGDYLRDGPFTLQYQDSGMVNAAVLYRAYTNESPRVIGGRKVKGFRSVTDPQILARLQSLARTNVVQADLWGQGITNLGVLARHGYALDWNGQTELLFQDHPMQLARWPNTNWLNIASAPVPGTNSFAYVGTQPATWASLSDVWVHGYWKNDWADSCEKIAALDLLNHVAFISPPGSQFGYKAGQRFYFLNVLEELDSPGEYYIDRSHGILYFWPPAVLTDGSAVISTADQLVTLTSVSNVAFTGITFEAAKNSLLFVTGGASNLINGCVLRGSSRNAVTIVNSPGSGVAYCDISEMGEMGLSITGSGNRVTLTRGTNFAQCNTIQQVSRLSWTYKPAIYLSGVGDSISHNLISDAPHSAILLFGNDHVLEFNEIHHVCNQTADAGAVYMGHDWTMRGNVFRYNYLHDINSGTWTTNVVEVVGLYLDDCFSGSTIFGNIFCSVDWGVEVGGGRDNLVENNIFVDCRVCSISVDQRLSSWMSYELTNANSTLLTNLRAMPYQAPPWSIRYPALVNILNDEPALAKGNVIQQNIRYGGSWLRLLDNVATVLTGTNNFASGDPLFVSYSQRQFGLLANSPALTLGFQPIPQSRFGPVPVGASRARIAVQ
jgi:hypothetical protein